MALSTGNTATWADVNNLYRRIVSERSRWNYTTAPAPVQGAAGNSMTAANINTLRTSLLNLVNNISFLSDFRSAVSATTAVSQGTVITPAMINALKTPINGMKDKVITNSSWSSGFGTFSAGNSAKTTSQTFWNSGWSSVWDFGSGGGFFGHSGDKSFGFTIKNTSHNPCSNNCSAFFTCGPHFVAGFCSNFYHDTI